MSGSHIIGFDGQHIDREQFFGRVEEFNRCNRGANCWAVQDKDAAEGGIMDYQFVIKSGRRIRGR